MFSSTGSRHQRSVSVGGEQRRNLSESMLHSLQRDVDNFTRQLEQEKRYFYTLFIWPNNSLSRLYGINEAHQMVYKEWKERAERIKIMKSPSKGENARLLSKLGILEREYNQVGIKISLAKFAHEESRSLCDTIKSNLKTRKCEIKSIYFEEIDKLFTASINRWKMRLRK